MTLRDLWLSYSKIFPADAHPTHIQEVKRGFYAAVYLVLMADSDPHELLRDAIVFGNQVRDGKDE